MHSKQPPSHKSRRWCSKHNMRKRLLEGDHHTYICDQCREEMDPNDLPPRIDDLLHLKPHGMTDEQYAAILRPKAHDKWGNKSAKRWILPGRGVDGKGYRK